MSTEVQAGQVRILTADDDIDIVRIIHKRLSQRGFEVITADDGEEAIEALLTEQPHAMVLDVMMPKMTGWEVCRYVREREAYEKIGVVMLTAIGSSLNEMTSPLYGADEYLDKPIDLDDLEAAVLRVLEKRAGLVVRP